VYAIGHSSISLRGKCMAAVLACGPGAALSHLSAADLSGLLATDSRIAVTVLRTRGGPLLEGENDVHEVDAVWPACRLVIQLDCFAYHRTRRDRERDAATDADLELVGYRVVCLTWNEVTTHRVRTTPDWACSYRTRD
jgi:hypothetical protein